MRLTRRQVVAGAGAAALGGSIYELVDRLTRAPERTAAVPKLPLEQHLLEGQRVVQSNGVEVIVPPLHHRVVTARVAGTDLKGAQRDLEQALAELEDRKSTRLNSSHRTISYAVFCLKKKNKKQKEMV